MRQESRDLDLVTRKAVIGRVLRSQADIGAVGEDEFRVLQGRVEQARSRLELDDVRRAIERRLEE